jgi:hypothetical protein
MCNRRFEIALTTCIALLTIANLSHGQGFVVADNAVVEAQVVQMSGLVGACGIRVRAQHSIGLQAVRTWEVTLYAAMYDSVGIAVEASSYDSDMAGTKPAARPAPTELSFSITGGRRVFTAAAFRPSQTKGGALALLSDKGAGQIMTAFQSGVPVVMFFRPQGAETEIVVVSGKPKARTNDTWGQCLQYLRGAQQGESCKRSPILACK